jgi:MFS-type transporter involved in bile tolerance (Atg22 family)
MKKRTYLLTLLLLFVTLSVHAEDGMVNKSILKDGVSLGSVIAAVISWSRNKSILLAIFHAVLGWIYVIYVALTRETQN